MNKVETIHEGEKKSITITIDSESASTLDGKEVTLYAFYKNEEIVLGSKTISDTEILFDSTNTHELKPNVRYKVEAWVDPDINSRRCVFPEDEDDFFLIAKDREKIE